MSKLIELTDCLGKIHLVNKDFVTHVEPKANGVLYRGGSTESPTPYNHEIWVKSHAGYGTASIRVNLSLEEIKTLLK